MNIELLTNYANLMKEKKDLDAQARIIKGEIAHIEDAVQEQFINNGVDSLKVNGQTLYLHQQLWASPKKRDGDSTDSAYERACKKLSEIGLDDFVNPRFSTQSLSAFVRERSSDGEPLPDGFEDVISVTEKISVRVRN